MRGVFPASSKRSVSLRDKVDEMRTNQDAQTRMIGELAAQGKAVVMVSSYLPELMGICDRLAVMTRGVLSEARPVSEWNEHSVMQVATGG